MMVKDPEAQSLPKSPMEVMSEGKLSSSGIDSKPRPALKHGCNAHVGSLCRHILFKTLASFFRIKRTKFEMQYKKSLT